jgi:hypothetical protein
MTGAKMAKAAQKLRDEMEKAWADGEDLPSVEAGFPIDLQKEIRNKLGDLPANLVEGLQEKIEALQEASDDLDEAVDVLEELGKGFEAQVKGEIAEETAKPELVQVHAGEETEHTDEHKVKGE